MNRLFISLSAAALLAGCAVETPYVDHEWGMAQQASWDTQVANPGDKYAGTNPTGLEGINGEEVMATYNQSFVEKTDKTKVFELGLTSEAGSSK